MRSGAEATIDRPEWRAGSTGRPSAGPRRAGRLRSVALELSSRQRKFLRGLAHGQPPLVQVGRAGVTAGVLAELDRALDEHELVKVRFQAEKEREAKVEAAASIEARLGCAEVGRVGHVAVFYRPQRDPERRKIHLIGR